MQMIGAAAGPAAAPVALTHGVVPAAAVTMVLLAVALLAWPAAPGRGAGRLRVWGARPAPGDLLAGAASRSRESSRPGGALGRQPFRTWPAVARRFGGAVRFGGAARTGPGGRRWLRAGIPAAAGLGGALAVSWPCGVAAAVAAATIHRLVRRARTDRRASRDVAAVTAALRALARDLRAGAVPDDAVGELVRDGPPAVEALLAALPGGRAGPDSRAEHPPAHEPGSAGGALDGALAGARARLLSGWELSARHGVPLAAVVTAIAEDLADRSGAARARAAQVAGPAVSGYVLAALPAAGLMLGAGMGTDPVAVLTGSTTGGILLVAGTLLCCGGLLWADRIVRR